VTRKAARTVIRALGERRCRSSSCDGTGPGRHAARSRRKGRRASTAAFGLPAEIAAAINRLVTEAQFKAAARRRADAIRADIDGPVLSRKWRRSRLRPGARPASSEEGCFAERLTDPGDGGVGRKGLRPVSGRLASLEHRLSLVDEACTGLAVVGRRRQAESGVRPRWSRAWRNRTSSPREIVPSCKRTARSGPSAMDLPGEGLRPAICRQAPRG